MVYRTTFGRWSKEELLHLIQLKNHIIKYDGFDYIWYIKYDNGIFRHCIVCEFNTPEKAWHWVKYNIAKWKEQLQETIKEENRLERSRVKRERHRLKRYKEIANDDSLTTKEKVTLLINLTDPGQLNEIATILKVSRKTVQRNIN